MTDTTKESDMQPRDGIRENELRDIGIEAEVRWGSGQRAVVTLDLLALDRLVGSDVHDECYSYDEVNVAETNARTTGYADGYARALADVAKLAVAT